MKDQYENDLADWRKSLDDNLREENSWLALAGLYWLDEGENSFGTNPDNQIVFPEGSGPGTIGSFLVDNDQVTLKVLEGIDVLAGGELTQEVLLKADTSGAPTEITLGNLSFILIQREESLGIRLWDNDRPERENFPGRRWYEIREDFCIPGRYDRYEKKQSLVLQRKNASDIETQAGGDLFFSKDGKEYTLLAFEEEDGELFIIFNDLTNGEDTYSAGRFLVIDPPEDGHVVIDFNRAYSTPCAFTDFATCPLPPAQNKLMLRVEAGEKKPED